MVLGATPVFGSISSGGFRKHSAGALFGNVTGVVRTRCAALRATLWARAGDTERCRRRRWRRDADVCGCARLVRCPRAAARARRRSRRRRLAAATAAAPAGRPGPAAPAPAAWAQPAAAWWAAAPTTLTTLWACRRTCRTARRSRRLCSSGSRRARSSSTTTTCSSSSSSSSCTRWARSPPPRTRRAGPESPGAVRAGRPAGPWMRVGGWSVGVGLLVVTGMPGQAPRRGRVLCVVRRVPAPAWVCCLEWAAPRVRLCGWPLEACGSCRGLVLCPLLAAVLRARLAPFSCLGSCPVLHHRLLPLLRASRPPLAAAMLRARLMGAQGAP